MATAIIDYGLGNLGSIRRAIEECGGDVFLAESSAQLQEAERIILPGVGAFGDGMKLLRQGGWVDPLREMVLDQKIPVLGICLGMQLLASVGEEGGTHQGLGFIQGKVVLMQVGEKERLPHVGWNNIHKKRECVLLKNIPDGADFYFVHSYHFQPQDASVVVATGDYASRFVAAVEDGNVFGTQFHPEKSGPYGFQIIKNFLHYYGDEDSSC